jgi:hypothetical protein
MNTNKNEITKAERLLQQLTLCPATISSKSSTTTHLPSYVSSATATRETLISIISSATAGNTNYQNIVV